MRPLAPPGATGGPLANPGPRVGPTVDPDQGPRRGAIREVEGREVDLKDVWKRGAGRSDRDEIQTDSLRAIPDKAGGRLLDKRSDRANKRGAAERGSDEKSDQASKPAEGKADKASTGPGEKKPAKLVWLTPTVLLDLPKPSFCEVAGLLDAQRQLAVDPARRDPRGY